MKFRKLTTHKLFYGKWTYKIRCYCKGSYMIARLGVPYALNECMTKKAGGIFRKDFEPDKLIEFIQDVDQFLDKDIKVRTEGGIFTIYCNDEKLFNKMTKRLEQWITEVHVPGNAAEQAFIEENGRRKVICNRLPFERYQYKVYIKERLDIQTRERLWTWMAKYDGKFRTPVRVATWLMGRKQWVTCPSIYAEDGPSLSMMLLFLGDRVSKVEEFVPRSLINIISEEQPCPV